MLNLSTILLFSENPKGLSDFYINVFGKKPEWEDNGYSGFALGKGMLMIGPHDKVKGKSQSPERIIINFETNDVNKDFERIKKIGAKVIAVPYHPMEENEALIATFADPDGNYFQLASPMKM